MKKALEELVRRGEKIYRQKLLRSSVGRKKGYFAAIEVESGDFFVAHLPVAAVEKAERAHPNKKFHLVRIGYPAAVALKKQQCH